MTRMFRAVVEAEIPTETLDAMAAYQRIQPLIARLQEIQPRLRDWVEHSRGSGPVPYADKERFIEMLAFNAEQDQQEYPGSPAPSGAGTSLTTALTNREWKTPGRTSIDYTPWCGKLTLTVLRPVEAFGSEEAAPTICRCVAAIAETIDTTFMATDVVCPAATGKRYETYYLNHRLFPHRRWLGWMGFVPVLVPHRFIPEAAKMEVVKGRGTIIVTVDEPFDLHNPDHIKRAHQVELRMANAGLLDVTDTSLLE
ncbi:TPA: immunity 52 family protein [Stenotrophomonas maltophilia]|nr:immunity 52 family protein [Stenotrophomonas maltophilia]HDS1156542.1 immunity 52 family protein [Stenotrophomonas maltophilia]HDS1163698.1 immunity 52 family protein [Stenotrophomonas maltophilia]HDS1169281.1 immunity 52 family protein [Stenotrophomonas maltophilia]HDS1173200.1 immunity 52 family protein [Stenotrophomonas maltophilia]